MISTLLKALNKIANKINTWCSTAVQQLTIKHRQFVAKAVRNEWQSFLVEIWFAIRWEVIILFWHTSLKIGAFLERVLLRLLPLEVHIIIGYRLFKRKYIFPVKGYFRLKYHYFEDVRKKDPMIIDKLIIAFMMGVVVMSIDYELIIMVLKT